MNFMKNLRDPLEQLSLDCIQPIGRFPLVFMATIRRRASGMSTGTENKFTFKTQLVNLLAENFD